MDQPRIRYLAFVCALYSFGLISCSARGPMPRTRAETPGPRSGVILIVDYGAKCDGRSDDSLAFAAATHASEETGFPIEVPENRTCVIVNTWLEYKTVRGLPGGGMEIGDTKGFMPRWGVRF